MTLVGFHAWIVRINPFNPTVAPKMGFWSRSTMDWLRQSRGPATLTFCRENGDERQRAHQRIHRVCVTRFRTGLGWRNVWTDDAAFLKGGCRQPAREHRGPPVAPRENASNRTNEAELCAIRLRILPEGSQGDADAIPPLSL